MTQEELRECLAMQRRIAALCREEKLYGIHRWGVQLTQKSYEALFGVQEPSPRRQREILGTEVFCLEEGAGHGQR